MVRTVRRQDEYIDFIVKREKKMRKMCEAFQMQDPVEAFQHLKLRTVENYGGSAYGHSLYTWDRGERWLGQCTCGGYVLVQESEYNSPNWSEEDDYVDYFPVSGPEEADELNRKYDGFSIEREFSGRILYSTNGKLHWG